MALVRSSHKLFGLVALVLILAAFSPGSARAQESGWSVCNHTSYVIETAIGRPDGGRVIVEGWTKLRPGSCRTVLNAPLEPGLYFLHGRSSSAHRGGSRHWGGDHPLCVDSTGSFSVESLQDCAGMGLDVQGFRPVLIETRTRWRTRFNETDDYGLKQAAAAGVQRLLEDAGVFSGKIDGVLGRKTREAIGDFLAERNLPADTNDPDLIDILEQVAEERARDVGMTLCNRTENRIWGAIARLAGEKWESRGWWMLEAGGCARVIDEPLLQTDHFVYGEMEDADGNIRVLRQATDGFCVARAKFAINGREDCEAAAYRTAFFAATQPPESRKIVFEFFARDFAEPSR